MFSRIKFSLGIAFLVLLTVGSYWFLQRLESELSPVDAPTPTRPIITAYGVFAQYFDNNNQLTYQMKSPEVLEYSNRAGTELLTPTVWVFEPSVEASQLIWLANASKAEISGDKNTLNLDESVILRYQPDQSDEIVFKSSQVIYNQQNRIIRSDLPATITNAQGVQQADAFVLDMNNQTVDFNGDISATFQTVLGENNAN